MKRRSAIIAVALAACGALTSCRSSSKHELTVYAASSLRESFDALAAAFQAAHANTHVRSSFAGSQELRLQLEHGARADVFASADSRQMEILRAAKLVTEPAAFAKNELCVAVSEKAAGKIRSFGDLPLAERIVLGAPNVPVGVYAGLLLDRATQRLGADFRTRVERKVVSRENNTRQVLAKVVLGEADAAIVYRTDVAAAKGKVHAVTIPRELDVVAVYPIAVLRDAPEPELARQWVAFVLSAEGQHLLRRAGLLSVSP
jgi:molybdate transport system substrate-binding protein